MYVGNNPTTANDPSGLGGTPSGDVPPTDVRIPYGVPGVGGCLAFQLGIGIGFILVGSGLEVASAVLEVVSGGAATPVVIVGIAIGAGDIAAGGLIATQACSPASFP